MSDDSELIEKAEQDGEPVPVETVGLFDSGEKTHEAGPLEGGVKVREAGPFEKGVKIEDAGSFDTDSTAIEMD